jgi:hypothetical protein
MADWQDIMASDTERALDIRQHQEATVFRRVLSLSKLSAGPSQPTLEQLTMGFGFPYRLAVHKFSKYERDSILRDMAKRPTKAALVLAHEEAAQTLGLEPVDVGLVFDWPGFGGWHVLTRLEVWPISPGSRGMFWKLGDYYYLVEPLAALVERLGDPKDW